MFYARRKREDDFGGFSGDVAEADFGADLEKFGAQEEFGVPVQSDEDVLKVLKARAGEVEKKLLKKRKADAEQEELPKKKNQGPRPKKSKNRKGVKRS